jgi:hypothetical protein
MSMGVSMRMHVSTPKIPKCICYAMHTKKVTFILIYKVVSKTKKISSGLRDRIDHDWREILGRVLHSLQNSDLIPTSINNALRGSLL